MATKTSKSSSSGLHLAIAFIPTLLSVLYLRSSSLPVVLNINNLQESVSSLYTTRTNVTKVTPFDRLQDQYAQACPQHTYKTRIFSMDPLIIYLENYISAPEREYLLNLAESGYTKSQVLEKDENDPDPTVRGKLSSSRSSQTAYLYNDPVSQCIMERSSSFQGNVTVDCIEDLQVVKYAIGDQFRTHFDWWEGAENPRVATFFAYLACDSGSESGESGDGKCEGGATQFPDYMKTFPAEWCDVIDCHDDNPDLGGIAFKPLAGNAIFWSNVHSNGTYHEGTMHAGMPVRKGRKVGLNIWTHQDPFESDYVEGVDGEHVKI